MYNFTETKSWYLKLEDDKQLEVIITDETAVLSLYDVNGTGKLVICEIDTDDYEDDYDAMLADMLNIFLQDRDQIIEKYGLEYMN